MSFDTELPKKIKIEKVGKKMIYGKLKLARVKVQEAELKKSGKNKHLGFSYYELGDVLPTVNKVFDDLGLLGVFSIKGDAQFGTATLTIYDTEDESFVVFESPTAQATLVKATPVQELGAVHTYLKRYLYLNALELVEPDLLDNVIGDNKSISSFASKEQIELIKRLYAEEVITEKILPYYKVKSLDKLKKQDADKTIANAKKND